eukprot:m.164909 g.164909  ORF g.164909 m.164909 type:complete len:86 (+) comp16419_c0_seq2:2089-2346(+)
MNLMWSEVSRPHPGATKDGPSLCRNVDMLKYRLTKVVLEKAVAQSCESWSNFEPRCLEMLLDSLDWNFLSVKDPSRKNSIGFGYC